MSIAMTSAEFKKTFGAAASWANTEEARQIDFNGLIKFLDDAKYDIPKELIQAAQAAVHTGCNEYKDATGEIGNWIRSIAFFRTIEKETGKTAAQFLGEHGLEFTEENSMSPQAMDAFKRYLDGLAKRTSV